MTRDWGCYAIERRENARKIGAHCQWQCGSNWKHGPDHLQSLTTVNNLQVLRRMAPSALRGLFLQRGRSRIASMKASHDAYFDFNYPKDHAKMEALYEKAKLLQWNGSQDPRLEYLG